MRQATDHLKRFPKVRPSTLAFLIAKEKKTEQLRREVMAKRNHLTRIWCTLRGLSKED